MSIKSLTPLPPANFTPEMGNYKALQPFRYWCQKVLPLVYDDSLSYYELLCKVVDYLNKTMEDVETLHGDVTNLHVAYEQLQNYVNKYFSSLDVQQEINNKLDEMVENGDFEEILRNFLNKELYTFNSMDDFYNSNITSGFALVSFNNKKCLFVINDKCTEYAGKNFKANYVSNTIYDQFTTGDIKKIFSIFNNSNKTIILNNNYTYDILNAEDKLIVRNFTVILNGTIKLNPNNLSNYCMIEITTNGIIKGSGTICGDMTTHIGTEGEYGHCVQIQNNGKISGVNITEAWGDCIYCYNISNAEISDVNCFNSRRNGISVISGSNITIKNSTINNIKSEILGAGIDVEPNRDETFYGCNIENCTITNCAYSVLVANDQSSNTNIKCLKTDSNVRCFNANITNSEINKIIINGNSTITNTIIKGVINTASALFCSINSCKIIVTSGDSAIVGNNRTLIENTNINAKGCMYACRNVGKICNSEIRDANNGIIGCNQVINSLITGVNVGVYITQDIYDSRNSINNCTIFSENECIVVQNSDAIISNNVLIRGTGNGCRVINSSIKSIANIHEKSETANTTGFDIYATDDASKIYSYYDTPIRTNNLNGTYVVISLDGTITKN